MPGRLHLATSPTQFGEMLGVITMDPSLRLWKPRYNIAPGHETLIIRAIEGLSTRAPIPRSMVGKPLAGMPCEITTARWGLAKDWAATPDVGVSTVELSLESLDRDPAFWTLLGQRRCLIPLDGYYEWRLIAAGSREPTWMGVIDEATRSAGPFVIAGVWDRWERNSADHDPGEEEGGAFVPAVVDTFAILTKPAEGEFAEIHPRMPVVMPLGGAVEWLNAEMNNAERQRSACMQINTRKLASYAVSQLVNSPRHDDPRCLEPAARLALPGFGD